MNEVTGEVRESFSLFTVDPAWKEFLRNFPPVSAPFGEYQASPGANILMTQKIGNIITNYPLCMIGEDQGSRTAIFAAEGIWKWRYFNFEENKNFDMVDDLVRRVVQYIGIKEDKKESLGYIRSSKYILKINLSYLMLNYLMNLTNRSILKMSSSPSPLLIVKIINLLLAKRRGLIPLTQGFSLPVAINIQRASIPKLVSKKSKDSSSYKESNSRPIRVRQTTTC